MRLIDEPDRMAAFGWPGIEPRWTHGGKDGVGTAYAASSRVWFTFWNGIITEVYYPTVDRPQLDEHIGTLSKKRVRQILDGIKLVLEPRELE